MSMTGKRISQGFIDQLLLSDSSEYKALGRLLGSNAWPAFEAWLDAESFDTPDAATDALCAIINYATIMIVGIAQEHWPLENKNTAETITNLTVERFKTLMERHVVALSNLHATEH